MLTPLESDDEREREHFKWAKDFSFMGKSQPRILLLMAVFFSCNMFSFSFQSLIHLRCQTGKWNYFNVFLFSPPGGLSPSYVPTYLSTSEFLRSFKSTTGVTDARHTSLSPLLKNILLGATKCMKNNPSLHPPDFYADLRDKGQWPFLLHRAGEHLLSANLSCLKHQLRISKQCRTYGVEGSVQPGTLNHNIKILRAHFFHNLFFTRYNFIIYVHNF